MNLNGNINLDFKNFRIDQKQVRKFLPLVVGLGLIALFAYTALTIRQAITVLPDSASTGPVKVVKFNKQTIQSLKNLTVIQDQTNISNLGTSNPFGP